MRYLVLALAFCFALSPLEAKIKTKPHVVKAKKNNYKAKGRKAPKPAKFRRNTAN